MGPPFPIWDSYNQQVYESRRRASKVFRNQFCLICRQDDKHIGIRDYRHLPYEHPAPCTVQSHREQPPRILADLIHSSNLSQKFTILKTPPVVGPPSAGLPPLDRPLHESRRTTTTLKRDRPTGTHHPIAPPFTEIRPTQDPILSIP